MTTLKSLVRQDIRGRDTSKDISYQVSKNDSGYRVAFMDMQGRIIDSIDCIPDHVTLQNRISHWIAWYIWMLNG